MRRIAGIDAWVGRGTGVAFLRGFASGGDVEALDALLDAWSG
jgi:hypothetical protein